MIKTLNPYNSSNTAKTAEIMSKYRPIAPKPETSMNEGSSSLSQKIKQSPYLRNLWPQLQARPTRTRKRGRASLALPSFKRQKAHVLGFCPHSHVTSPPNNLSLQSFSHGGLPQLPLSNPNLGMLNCSLENPAANTNTVPSLVTLPLLPCSPEEKMTVPELDSTKPCREKVIDLNTLAEFPEDKDLSLQLQAPTAAVSNVIAPQPVRPVGSRITVGMISQGPSLPPADKKLKRKEEVEEEIEAEVLPAVISDSNNKVRVANSAYKDLVGQPECSWLDSMVTGGRTCKRICGEVTLSLRESRLPISTNGFSCWVSIEWEADRKRRSVDAFCDVTRLSCEFRDYLFIWKFHTARAARGASQSSFNV